MESALSIWLHIMKKLILLIITIILQLICITIIYSDELFVEINSAKNIHKYDMDLLPIDDQQEAIEFSLNIEEMKRLLLEAEDNAGYHGWKSIARLININKNELWEVTIVSNKGILPAYKCKASFTSDGHLLKNDILSPVQCGYSK